MFVVSVTLCDDDARGGRITCKSCAIFTAFSNCALSKLRDFVLSARMKRSIASVFRTFFSQTACHSDRDHKGW